MTETVQTEGVLGAAQDYVARGWRIIPLWWPEADGTCACPNGAECSEPGKHPYGKLVPNGYTNATDDPEVVRAWWTQEPRCNVGGRHPDAIVADFDDRASIRDLSTPPAPFAETSRGYHVHFRRPEGMAPSDDNTKRYGPFDWRGNGYVVLPPSRHSSGVVYRWCDGLSPEEVDIAPCPGWFLKALSAKAEGSKGRKRRATGKIKCGTRHGVRCSLAGTLRSAGLGPEGILAALRVTNRDDCEPDANGKLVPDDELVGIAYGIGAKPATRDLGAESANMASLLAAAEACGQSVQQARVGCDDQVDEPQNVGSILGARQGTARAFRTSGAHEVFERLGEVQFDWPGYIVRGMVNLIVGPPGAGKSAFCLALADAFTRPGLWPDGSAAPECTPVVWLDCEGSTQGTVERAVKWGLHCDRLRVIDEPTDFVFKDPVGIRRVIATAAAEGARVVVIDSLASSHTKDENSAEMRMVLTDLANAAATHGLTIIVVHHFRKRGVLEGPEPDLDRVRGSSAIVALCRSVVAVWQPVREDPTRNVDSIKSNFSRRPERLGFEFSERGLNYCEPVVPKAPATAKDECADWLEALLSGGKRPRQEVLALAAEVGFKERTLERARKQLGVVVVPGYDAARQVTSSEWGLPD